jgi:hypothetical protein
MPRQPVRTGDELCRRTSLTSHVGKLRCRAGLQSERSSCAAWDPMRTSRAGKPCWQVLARLGKSCWEAVLASRCQAALTDTPHKPTSVDELEDRYRVLHDFPAAICSASRLTNREGVAAPRLAAACHSARPCFSNRGVYLRFGESEGSWKQRDDNAAKSPSSTSSAQRGEGLAHWASVGHEGKRLELGPIRGLVLASTDAHGLFAAGLL